MVRAGQIIENQRGEFCLAEKLELLTGTVSSHSDGFGFVQRDDGNQDIYLSTLEMRSLIDGDRVTVKPVTNNHRDRLEGRVVEVLEHRLFKVVGQFIRERGIGFVIPDNPKISHRILVPKGKTSSAKPGQIVVVRILEYPSDVEQPVGKIIRVIGGVEKKGIATEVAIHSHDIPTIWPKDVREYVKKISHTISTDAKKGRVDLSGMDLVTIDDLDARDFDDPTALVVSTIKKRDIGGRVVRIVLQLKSRQSASLRDSEITSALASAYSHSVVREVDNEARTRIRGISAETLTHFELLEHYFEDKGYDQDRIKLLLSVARSIFDGAEN